MAAEEQSNSNNNRSRKSKKRPRAVSETKLEQLDSLSWKPSVKEIDGGDGDLSLFIGSDDLQGGFLSLEEIDEVDYGLEIPNVDVAKEEGDFERTPKSQKTTSSKSGADDSCLNQSHDECHGENQVGRKDNENDPIKQKGVKKKNKGSRKKNNVKNDHAIKQSEPAAGNDDKSNDDDASYLEEEYSAWNELRLHPLIMKSICRLKFKKPTEVQRACIPAAAHQGKDVIGAAETGSGKTLAFGLPIFQRLLEEREKAERLLTGVEDANERVAPRGVLRALIVTPTRELALQVTDHLKAVAVGTNIRVVPVVGGMSTEKQERLLKARPEIVVGTPGRLWEIMSRGEPHLVELHSLSFFVLDEADRMIEAGHFSELQSIIDMLPIGRESTEIQAQNMNCVTVHSTQRKKRQTFVFSATLSLSSSFRRKLKSGKVNAVKDGLDSIESLSQRAGMRANTAIVDLTNASVLVRNLVESVINCTEEEKDGYLYYILSVHGQGRTIVFCTSISALRRISSILRILHVNVWNLHSEMQQRARLKSVDHFRATEDSVLIATDAAARGLDIPGVRTVIHYQLPLSADVYVHRCGRTARASTDGCSIALISPTDASNFAALSKSFQKESFQQFPVDLSYMQDIMKRSSLAHQIDKISRNTSKEKAERNWLERNAEALDLDLDEDDSEEERMKKHKQKKAKLNQLNKLQQELDSLLAVPLQPKTFSRRFLAGAGVSPLLQCQFEAMAKEKLKDANHPEPNKRRKFVVIGQDFVEPLQALKSAGTEACLDLKRIAEKKSNLDKLRRKRKEMKKCLRDERKNQKRKNKRQDAQ